MREKETYLKHDLNATLGCDTLAAVGRPLPHFLPQVCPLTVPVTQHVTFLGHDHAPVSDEQHVLRVSHDGMAHVHVTLGKRSLIHLLHTRKHTDNKIVYEVN